MDSTENRYHFTNVQSSSKRQMTVSVRIDLARSDSHFVSNEKNQADSEILNRTAAALQVSQTGFTD